MSREKRILRRLTLERPTTKQHPLLTCPARHARPCSVLPRLATSTTNIQSVTASMTKQKHRNITAFCRASEQALSRDEHNHRHIRQDHFRTHTCQRQQSIPRKGRRPRSSSPRQSWPPPQRRKQSEPYYPYEVVRGTTTKSCW